MKSLCIRFLLFMVALCLRLRYRITYKGLDEIKEKLKGSEKGTLFLPNHPAAIIDPLILSVPLVRNFQIRPLVVEYMYFQPLFYSALRWIHALPMPNFSTGFNPLKLKRAEKMLKKMGEGLNARECFLIYPAGTTKSRGLEVIGGAFGVHQLVSENPDANVVLVRMTGLWGSSFSRALTAGDTPDAKASLLKGFWTVIKNLFFFVPKRSVLVEFELADSRLATPLPKKGSKQELNTYLQEWYNAPFGPDGEPLSLVSYSFYRNEIPEVQGKKLDSFDLSSVPEEVQKQIVAKLALLSKMPPAQILPNLHLVEHLGLDSLDMAELISFLEDHYDASGMTPDDLTTVQRLYAIATKAYTKKEAQEPVWNTKSWNKERGEQKLSIAEACSIPEAFFKACDKRLFQVACADPMRGVLSYYKVKKAVLVLSKLIEKMPGERIGILLPASSTAYILVLACQFAKKTPVMINWTVGGKHLDTVISVSKIQVVLSSWTFLDALENIDLSSIEPLLSVLEELKVKIPFLDVLKASCKAFLPSRCFSFTHIEPDSEAVVLFTSGTEGMPKGVPLTHANILTNQVAALDVVQLFDYDKLLAFLPPFHSFGFSITGLLPLLCGMRVVFYPNPTDSKRLAKAVDHWKVSVVCSAPTFLRNIFHVAPKNSLSSLRLLISGAEKVPDELFSQMQRFVPHAVLYEGYGITECAPVLSVNISGNRKRGVGKAIPGVSLLVVDPENITRQKQANEVGLILATGPNVFAGYLNHDARDPFITIGETRWYQTGDLGAKNEQGELILSGRLKRFIKIGGEMVSLTAIEEALTSKSADAPQVAVHVDGDVLGKVQLILISIHELDVVAVNQLLRKSGFSNLVKIDKVIVVDAIPQTATGKIAYRALEKLLESHA